MRVGLVTCRALPEPDPDQEPLLAALRDAGVEAELLPWDEPETDPAAFDLCVLRSCWNYYLDPEAFLAWLARAESCTRVVNPPDVVRWNLHKRYLAELEGEGVPTVPTVWIERGARASLAAILARHVWGEVVVKPCVSAASFRTRRFAAGEVDEGQRFLDELVAERDAMVQRFQPAVARQGEKALVWIAGEWTHAVRKAPRFDREDERVSEALGLSPAERELAEQVLAPRRTGLAYARLDLIPADDGTPLVSELELIEPSLFLLQYPPALERLTAALLAAAG